MHGVRIKWIPFIKDVNRFHFPTQSIMHRDPGEHENGIANETDDKEWEEVEKAITRVAIENKLHVWCTPLCRWDGHNSLCRCPRCHRIVCVCVRAECVRETVNYLLLLSKSSSHYDFSSSFLFKNTIAIAALLTHTRNSSRRKKKKWETDRGRRNEKWLYSK